MSPSSLHRLPWSATVLTMVFLAAAAWPARGSETRPLELDVLLPEDAEMEVDGYRPAATGEHRSFTSDPLEVGHTYVYSLRAAYQGTAIVRDVRLQPGRPVTVDLRRDLGTPPPLPPAPSIQLHLPSSLELSPGQEKPFSVRVTRAGVPEQIAITFDQLPQGVSIPTVILEPGQTESRATIQVNPDARAEARQVKALARSGSTTHSTRISVQITPSKSSPGSRSQVQRRRHSG